MATIEQIVRATQQDLASKWLSWLAGLDDVQKGILHKYTILDEQGLPTVVKLKNPKDRGTPLPDAKISLPTVRRLVAADTTKDHKWLDWIFYHAGGGDDGKRGSVDGMDTVKRRFIDERTKGYLHPKKKVQIPGISKAEAEAKWEQNLSEVRKIMEVGDEDTIAKLHSFGYSREWPGYEQRYESVATAIHTFLLLYENALQMNQELNAEGREQVLLEPDQIKGPKEMDAISHKVKKYFGSKAARDDIRVEMIYEDEVITAMAPLTYAAAVKYGCDEWHWANRDAFEKTLAADDTFSDNWKRLTERGTFFVYLTFQVPVPSWIVRSDKKFERRYLRHLAVVLDAAKAKRLAASAMTFTDEDKNENRSTGDVLQILLDEPTRVDNPEEEEYPLKRGARVYKTVEEARHVADHFLAAVEAVSAWAERFDVKRIKSNTTELELSH